MQGLWTIEFGSVMGSFGTGVIVLQAGKVFGGDNSYYYTGDYHTGTEARFSARLNIFPFVIGMQSVFGTAGEVQMLLTGSLSKDGKHGTATGTITGASSAELGVKLTKRA